MAETLLVEREQSSRRLEECLGVVEDAEVSAEAAREVGLEAAEAARLLATDRGGTDRGGTEPPSRAMPQAEAAEGEALAACRTKLQQMELLLLETSLENEALRAQMATAGLVPDPERWQVALEEAAWTDGGVGGSGGGGDERKAAPAAACTSGGGGSGGVSGIGGHARGGSLWYEDAGYAEDTTEFSLGLGFGAGGGGGGEVEVGSGEPDGEPSVSVDHGVFNAILQEAALADMRRAAAEAAAAEAAAAEAAAARTAVAGGSGRGDGALAAAVAATPVTEAAAAEAAAASAEAAAASAAAAVACPQGDVAAAVAWVWDRVAAWAHEHGNLRPIEVFREFDKQRTGFVTRAAFTSALKRMGVALPPERGSGRSAKRGEPPPQQQQAAVVVVDVAGAALAAADKDGDGRLEYRDLLAMLKRREHAAKAQTFAALKDDARRTAAAAATKNHSSDTDGSGGKRRGSSLGPVSCNEA